MAQTIGLRRLRSASWPNKTHNRRRGPRFLSARRCNFPCTQAAADVTAESRPAPDAAPVVAYVAGTLGTLIGADILNLRKIHGLGAPVASIGGAGTFDGIFLAGIIAVMLT